jgi:hypothetical protein
MPVITGGRVIEGGLGPYTIAGAPSDGVDEIQTVTIGGTPTSGTFNLTFDGHTTAAITWSATNNTLLANVDAALEALPNIGVGGVTTADSTLSSGIGALTVTFTGNNAKKNVALMTANAAGLVGTAPTVVVTLTTTGVDASFRGALPGATLNDITNADFYVNTGTALSPIWSNTVGDVPSGITASAAELNTLTSVTAGTAAASKAVVLGASKEIATITTATITNLTTTTATVTTGNVTTVNATNVDAGASGTAGTVDIFPTTASKGKLALTAADNTGNTTTTIVNANQATTRTYTIPDALANSSFLLGLMGGASVARTATADGLTTGTIADGGVMQFVTVTSADANHIVVLPTPTPGTIILLANGATGYELRSSAPATVLINDGTGGAAVESAIAASTLVIAVCKDATHWAAIQLAGTTLAAVEAAA